MYSTTTNKGTFFQNDKAKEISTEKCIYGSFSQKVKDARAENGHSFENWNIRFVGVACGKATTLPLKDRDFIELKAWSVHNPYNKEKGRNEPYILCTDFDVVTDEQNNSDGEKVDLNGFVEIGDADVPFN